MEKYGFIYIWYDRKHKRFYIGSHWGTTDDGYICSSTWMKNSYRRRPQDFRRRILKIVSVRSNLLDEEFHYLEMIKDEELGKRYYNLKNHKFIHWSHREDTDKSRQSISEKVSSYMQNLSKEERSARHGNKAKLNKPVSEETRAKLSEKSKNRQSPMKGRKHSPETKLKMSLARKKLLSNEHDNNEVR